MEELLASSTQKTFDLTRGQEIEGTIIQITEKEVTLDFGYKSEGVIPARDIPNLDSLKVGAKLKAFVEELENDSNQVVLGIQRTPKTVGVTKKSSGNGLSDEVWDKLKEKYTDATVKGTVTKVTQFGVFVQLEEGVEGLIHISKLGPDDDFKAGDSLSVTIDSFDAEKKRISLVPVITSTKGLIYK